MTKKDIFSQKEVETDFTHHTTSMISRQHKSTDTKTVKNQIGLMSDMPDSDIIFKTDANSKWQSPEALKYFIPAYFKKMKKEKGKQVRGQKEKLIRNLRIQMTKFRDGWLLSNSWKHITADGDTNGLYSDSDIFSLRRKCKYMFHFIDCLIHHYHNTTITCCAELTIKKIEEFESSTEIDDIDNKIAPKTILRWYKSFVANGAFPSTKKTNGKSSLPPLLEDNPDVKEAVIRYCNDNLATLTAELLHSYILEKCIPELLKIRQIETGNTSMTVADIFKENQLKTLHPRTVLNWMHALGYKYSPRKKNYYNDKHESVENISYRKQFIKRYFEYELLSHRWIQLPLLEYERLKKEGETFCGTGYKYKDEKGSTYIEFHVDDSQYLTTLGSKTPFGGYLSVRKPKDEKPMIIFGQDECIFKQFIFRNKCWMGPKGQCPLTPKDEGQGLMVSGFVSREYGFDWKLSEKELDKVNTQRKNKDYIDREAAISKYGKATKPKLKCSPFRRDLEYGANNEGYWTYENMILQVEDCIDCLRAVNDDKFQYLFLFDHSNGHDRSAPDALKVDAIRKNYGGSQPKMRNTTILDQSFLGPHQHNQKLKVGQTQSMVFTNTDDGPFYLSHEERQSRKFDKVIGTKNVKYTKPDLILKLKAKGVSNPKGGTKKLQKLCKANDIPITRPKLHIEEGWLNKAKGALQVLYERGWIDPSIDPKQYTMKGRIDEFGNRNIKRSLKSIISQQPNFMHEQTMLQHYCNKLGIKSDRTPVAHCKIAGEGIEFDWGFSKLNYRAKPITLKRNKSKFHTLVHSVLGKEVLTLEVCRANARRARQYMLAYATLETAATNQNQPAPSTDNPSKETKQHKETKQNTNETTVTHSMIKQ